MAKKSGQFTLVAILVYNIDIYKGVVVNGHIQALEIYLVKNVYQSLLKLLDVKYKPTLKRCVYKLFLILY